MDNNTRRYVVHVRTQHDVYIGRGSKWGNPFRIGKDGDRAEVIRKYFRYLMESPELVDALPELSGKRLGCYCSPQACHGDVLAFFANNLRQLDSSCCVCSQFNCEYRWDWYNMDGDCIACK